MQSPSSVPLNSAELQVETLICGAISQALEALLSENGIKVYGRVCGNVNEVLKAFAAGLLGETQYAMPGCCGQHDGVSVAAASVAGGPQTDEDQT